MHSTIQPFTISIDKISLTCNDTGESQVVETSENLLEFADQHHCFVRSSRWHKIQCTIPIPGSLETFLIQAGARFSDISDYRVEFNPAIIGSDGLAYIISTLDDLTGIGANELFANGKVTRIDMALDLPGLSLEEICVRSLGQRKHFVHTGQKGEIETVYLGSQKSNQTVVYQKDIRRESQFIRVERRLKPNLTGQQLHSLVNPFEKVQMVPTSVLVPHLDGMIPRQFFDSVRLRGIRNAISKLPPWQRRAIKRVLADPTNALLPPMSVIWDRWPDVLTKCGLGPICSPVAGRKAAE
jgi:hypothetical protein